jgi:hypothetical protein
MNIHPSTDHGGLGGPSLHQVVKLSMVLRLLPLAWALLCDVFAEMWEEAKDSDTLTRHGPSRMCLLDGQSDPYHPIFSLGKSMVSFPFFLFFNARHRA